MKDTDVLVYPNPASNQLFIQTGLNLANSVFNIYNLSGEMVLQQQINSKTDVINISCLISGVYIYKIEQNNKIIDTGKFVKN